MLALRLEQGRQGVSEVDRRQKEPWQGCKSQRPPPHEPVVSIRDKISQWEGRSQQVGSPEPRLHERRPTVTRARSEDILGNVRSSRISTAKTLGLDFRESPEQSARSTATWKSQLQKCATQFSAATIEKQLVPANQFASTKAESNQTGIASGEHKVGRIEDVEVVSKPLPLLTDDQEDGMPAGNFYTSRGFWRKLEGNRLLWERGRESSGEAIPPPKPQRTFQYQGANSSTGRPLHNNHSNGRSRRAVRPPNFPPPPCPVVRTEGLSRHKKYRKSFEYEDAARLTAERGTLRDEVRQSGLHHAYSDDNIYEDIVCEATRDNPYEDVKLSPMCIPIPSNHISKLSPKNQTMHGYAGHVHRKVVQVSKASTLANSHKPTIPQRPSTLKIQRMPQYVNEILTIFDEKRGSKRVKYQGISMREEASGTESDTEDGSDGSRRSVYKQSTLKRRPGYRTLERDLIQLQQQQLFQMFVVVSLRKASVGNTYSPEITQLFPKVFEKSSPLSREAADQLKVIPKFCFPDTLDWKPSAYMPSETFSFVLTGEDGSRWFCYCRKLLPSGRGKTLPEVHCIVSKLGCFNLFAKILEEVERRRALSPALVYPFMRSVMEAPFPAPGRTVTVKSFLPGTGNEVLTLCRPVDSRLEHVDFDSLLQCLSVGKLLQVFASLLLERRVIFIAHKLSVLSRCSHAVLALLYPFTWQHTFVPVLPADMLDISCSPTPFLIGVLAPCLPKLLELPIEEVLIVDLCEDKFVAQLGDEDCILPSKLQAALQQILEEREQILRHDDGEVHGDGCLNYQPADLSSLVSEGFVRFFVEIVGHYPLHMAETSSGTKELQRDSFRKSHPSRGVRLFLQLFMETQMFAGFIQDKELRKGRGRGLFEARVAEYQDSCPKSEPSGVNRFLKGLGNKMKRLQIK